MIFSSQIARRLFLNLRQGNTIYILNKRISKQFLQIIIGFAIIYPFLILKLNGASIFNFLSLNGIFEMNNKMAILRYSGHFSEPIFCQVFLICVYFAPVYGGFLYSQLEKKKILCLITLLPAFLVLITQNTKLTFIFAILLWSMSYWIYHIFADIPLFIHFDIKKIVKIALIGCSIVILLFTSMLLKIGKIDKQNFEHVKVKFIAYSFGALPSADIWFDQYLNQEKHEYHYGVKTFYGITNMIGIADRKQGVFYDEKITFATYKKIPLICNIFTYFRYVIEDFGIIGSLIFFFLSGFISSCSYYMLRKKQCVFLSILIFLLSTSFYCYLYQPVTTMYTSCVIMFLLFYFVLKSSYSIQTR
jgi:oligosaccharide repeat unit polymerase